MLFRSAFSPVARAFLTGTLRDVASLGEKDIRRGMPRFEPASYAANLALLPPYEALARRLNCSPAQLALAWLLARAPHVIPIPGTTSRAHLSENLDAAALAVPPEAMAELDALFAPGRITGKRYGVQGENEVDTETWSG